MRRRMMMGKVSYPYDSKVEYLEIGSSSTFYIVTGKVLPSTGVFQIVADIFLGSSNDATSLVTKYTSGGNGFTFGVTDKSPRVFTTQSNEMPVSLGVNERHQVSLSGDGSDYWYLNYDNNPTPYSFSRGYKWKNGSRTITLLARSDNYTEQTQAGTKIYGYKFYFDRELVLDLIPVRIEQVGYLYDKVSGELFGNAGTGSFVLGPDK